MARFEAALEQEARKSDQEDQMSSKEAYKAKQQPFSWIQMTSGSQNHLTWTKLHFYPWEARWAENPEGRPRQKLEQEKEKEKNKKEMKKKKWKILKKNEQSRKEMKRIEKKRRI